MITDPRSSFTETKSSRKESSFPAEMPLIKSVGAANRQSLPIPRNFLALYHRNAKIRIRSDERDEVEYDVKNYVDRGESFHDLSPPRLKAKEDNILRDQHNPLHNTKGEFKNIYVFIQMLLF